MKKVLWLGIGLIILGSIGVSIMYLKNIPTPAREGFACNGCNIILISVDSLRADHMSAYGYHRDTTPTFDRFAKRGFLFTNYFSTSFLTPVAEMSVHTGLYPTTHGVSNFDTALPADRKTLAEILKTAGYSTAALVTSPEFVGNLPLKESFSRGFDEYEVAYETSSEPAIHPRNYPTDSALVSFITEERSGPTFFWLALGGVHWPYGLQASERFENPSYAGPFKDLLLDWNLFQNFYNNLRYPEKTPLAAEDLQYVVDKYDNDVLAFDDFLGKLLALLEVREMLENTILIVQSEHGEDLGEHGYIAHYDVFDTQTHVPLLIYVPNAQGKRIDALSSGVDVLPTLSALLGIPQPDSAQGISLVPEMEGKGNTRSEVFLERAPLWEEAHIGIRAGLEKNGYPVVSGIYRDIAIRTERFKYILRLSRERVEQISWWRHITGEAVSIPEAELYDLKNDSGETQNVIEEFPEEARALRARLEKWYEQQKADAPSKIEHNAEVQPYF